MSENRRDVWKSGPAPQMLTRPYYERLHSLEQRHGWHRGMRAYSNALLAPLLRGGAVRHVLDVGCGTGGMLAWLRSFPGVRSVGLEYTRDALAFCRAGGHHELTEASALTLPFRSGVFDLLVCTDVLQHLPYPPGPEAALAEALRVLRPGGHLFLRTNSAWGETSSQAATYRRYLRSDLVAEVRAAGFIVQRASYANLVPALPTLARRRFLPRAAGHVHVEHDPGLQLQTRSPKLKWIDDALAGVLRGEAGVLSNVGVDLPLGDSLLLLAGKPAGAGT
ncbi:MAG: class I SAM-dependent methyltransferase [Chloroflexota bacterium]